MAEAALQCLDELLLGDLYRRACQELGADAVLVNTALATANHPESMGHAFKNAVSAGREAFLSGLGSVTNLASPTSPLTGFLAEN